MAEIGGGSSSRCAVLLSGGFRPFFLLAAVWAALIVPLWLGLLVGHVALPTLMAPLTWHVHEAVFGFGAAVVAGFLLTAVPNWTGRLPLRGTPLGVLVLVWVLGRLGVLCSAYNSAMAIKFGRKGHSPPKPQVGFELLSRPCCTQPRLMCTNRSCPKARVMGALTYTSRCGALKSAVGWVLTKPTVVDKPQSPLAKLIQRFLA